jgi:DNA invertase Pin-like site-specific DNA recombinase
LNKRYNAGLYLRLSVEDAANSPKRGKVNPFQNQSASIENQRAILTEYAELQGWDIAGAYIDDGYSGGAFDNRPAFQRMVRDAEAGLINLILTKDMSRLGRDYIETGRYTEDVFPSLGVRFIALMDNIDTEGDADLLPFRSILNDWHLRDLSRKVKSVIKAKAERGEYIGAYALYGFIKDPSNRNRLLIDEPAAAVVRRVFDMRLQGLGSYKIAATLNNDGTPSPSTYIRQRDGIEYPVKAWIACVIRRMLENEAYIGHAVRFKVGSVSYKNHKAISKPKDEWIRCEGAFPAIINREVWDAVQAVNADRSQKSNTKATCGTSLFQGLLRCADCGASMMYRSSSRATKTGKYVYRSYVCLKYQNTKGSVCSRHGIPENDLLAFIREDVQRHLAIAETDETRVFSKVHKRLAGAELEKARRELSAVKKRLTELSVLEVKLYEDRLAGIINLDTFKALSAKAEDERVSKQSDLDALASAITEAESQASDMSKWLTAIREYLSFDKPTHEALVALIEKIEVGENVGTLKQRVQSLKIYYRFVGAVE